MRWSWDRVGAAVRWRSRLAQAPPPTPRAQSPIDLTGQWVSLVTDDWRWRMVTPPKGDVLYLPVNDAGRRMAEQWDPARDAAPARPAAPTARAASCTCRAGSASRWEDDTTLKLETDTGQQTRLFYFGNAAQPPAEATWQGFSRAAWELPGGGGRTRARARRGGSAAGRVDARGHDTHEARLSTAATACPTGRTRR